MLYTVENDFLKIDETEGTIQNSSQIFHVEVSDKPVPDSGFILYPLHKISFVGTRYLRCIEQGKFAIVRVVPFLVEVGAAVSSGDSTSGSASFNQNDVYDIFKP